MATVRVEALLGEEGKTYRLGLRFLAGKRGLKHEIVVPWIQKPGLALAGHLGHIEAGRLQFFGQSEASYLASMSAAEQRTSLTALFARDIAGIIVSFEVARPRVLLHAARRAGVAVLQSTTPSPIFYDRISRFLSHHLTQESTVHGVLVDTFGIGVLIVGESGIGKSECALDLVMRGHRLVADDVVALRLRPPSTVYGFGSELIKHHMEIRGLGIINIKDLFGIASVRDEKVIELVVELETWQEGGMYDRLGLDEERFSVLGVDIPKLRVPVSPGRNITSIIEVAARNQLLKIKGHHSAREFQKSLHRRMQGHALTPRDPVSDLE